MSRGIALEGPSPATISMKIYLGTKYILLLQRTVAGLVSSCLLLMSSAKSSVRGSLSNHAHQLVCVRLVLLACQTSKLPTSIAKSTNKVFQTFVKGLTDSSVMDTFILQSRNVKEDIKISKMRGDKDFVKEQKALKLTRGGNRLPRSTC